MYKRQAVAQARSIKEDADEQGRHAYEQALDSSRRAAEERGRASVAKGQSEADGVRTRARGATLERAVERVIAEFRRRAGA